MHRNLTTLILATTLSAVLPATPAAAQPGRLHVGGTVAIGTQAGPDRRGYPERGSRYERGDYAFSNGFGDGYEKGIDDARDGDRYDPRHHRRYRDAEHGYRRDYHLRRDVYRDHYRQGFLNGYEEGYRDARRGAYGRRDRYDDRYPPDRNRHQGGFWLRFRF